MPEREERFDGGKRPVPTSWRALIYRSSEFLEIGKSDGAEWLPCR